MKHIAMFLDIILTSLDVFWVFFIPEMLVGRRERFRGKKGTALILTAGIFTVAIVIGLNQIQLVSIYTGLLFMFLALVFVWLFWDLSINVAITISGMYLLYLLVTGLIDMIIVGRIGGDALLEKITEEEEIERVLYLLTAGVIWNMVVYGIFRGLHRLQRLSIPIQHVLLLIASVIGFSVIYEQLLETFNAVNSWIAIASIIVFSAALMGVYYQKQMSDLRQRSAVMERMNEITEEKYKILQESYEQNAKFYHDMKHHLAVIQQLLDGGTDKQACREYIADLNEEMSALQRNKWTGVDLIDLILTDKQKRAEIKGLSLQIDAEILPSTLSIRNSELCSLLANPLDNALEAAVSYIKVTIRRLGENVSIEIVNDHHNSMKNGTMRPITTKENPQLHGYGLRNVEEIAQKYGGTVRYNNTGKEFIIQINAYMIKRGPEA